jgi:hypothetical protein
MTYDQELLLIDLANPGESRLLLSGVGPAQYAPTGHLLYSRNGRLFSVPFDLDEMRVAGEPTPVLDDIRIEEMENAQFAMSDDGTMVYAAGFDARTGYLAWIDRDGRRERLDLPRQNYGAFSISRNGQKIAIPIRDHAGQDIWIFDLDRMRVPTRLTFDIFAWGCAWSRDDRVVFFGSETVERDRDDILAAFVDGGNREATTVINGNPVAAAVTMTPDGRELVYAMKAKESLFDLWRAPIEISADSVTVGEEELLLGSPHLELFPAISPDGKWIAYTSDETGRWEIYVATYPDHEQRIRVSSEGGEEARWNPDGSELIYRWGSQWFAADVRFEPEIGFGVPRVLFEGPFVNVKGYSWDLSPDGERFLVIEGPEQDLALTELQVLTRFLDRLR